MSNSVKASDFVTMEKYEMVKNMMTVGVCSVCGQAVSATKNDLAPRHGYKRYRRKRVTPITKIPTGYFSQEDDKACAGSGKEVVWKKVK